MALSIKVMAASVNVWRQRNQAKRKPSKAANVLIIGGEAIKRSNGVA